MSTRTAAASSESKKKGFATVAVGAATVTAGIVVGWPLAVIGAVPTAVLGWRWWKHRVENGLRL